MDLPGVIIGGAAVGIQPREKPGGQGGIHFSLAADPTNANLVYVGGDRQQGTGANNNLFPNPIGANTYSGNLFRGNRSVAQGAGVASLASAQWTPLTHNFAAGGGSPHADSRRMVFDSNGDIIESDDGGVYRRTSPANAAGSWQSVNGNLTVAEFWTVSLDTVNTIVFGGTQDTGTVEQAASGSITFDSITLGDGFFTAVDNTSIANSAVRYTMGNTFTSFQRARFQQRKHASRCHGNRAIGRTGNSSHQSQWIERYGRCRECFAQCLCPQRYRSAFDDGGGYWCV